MHSLEGHDTIRMPTFVDTRQLRQSCNTHAHTHSSALRLKPRQSAIKGAQHYSTQKVAASTTNRPRCPHFQKTRTPPRRHKRKPPRQKKKKEKRVHAKRHSQPRSLQPHSVSSKRAGQLLGASVMSARPGSGGVLYDAGRRRTYKREAQWSGGREHAAQRAARMEWHARFGTAVTTLVSARTQAGSVTAGIENSR